MVKPSYLVALLTAGLVVAACGNYAKREQCTQLSDPNCVNEPAPTLPDLQGPNPDFPNPAAFRSTAKLDETPGKTSLVLNELLLDPVGDNAGHQKLEIWNAGSSDMNAAEFALIAGEQSFQLPEGTVIPAGGFLVVHLGAAGSNDAFNVYAPQVGELSAATGDMVLATRDGQLTDYVQWGASGQAHEADAEAEGQWVSGYACLAPVEGASLSFKSNSELINSNWDFIAKHPSLGESNE